jgi:hypothetical protein
MIYVFLNQVSIYMGEIVRICYTDTKRETFLNATYKTRCISRLSRARDYRTILNRLFPQGT